MRGEYRRRSDGPTAYKEDLKARNRPTRKTPDLVREFRDALRGEDKFTEGFKKAT